MTPFEPRSLASHTLTSADALAWETLPRDGRRSDFWLLIGLAGGGGMILGFLPDEWTDGWRFWAIGGFFCVLAFGIFVLVRTLLAYRKARRRIPVPITQTVDILPHGIAVVSGSGRRVLAREAIATVVATATHLFVAGADDLVIVPLGVFDDAADLQRTGQMIEAALRDDD
ncbi:hypothetical protein SAMN02983003_2284 [Devosia enhydra]|uniref:YcxB-like protein n=1 Tax=Devosia enhydra TaxID=665118 RepID=A0A1K2HYB3_9HYPH|nr:hypothetical protein [Devosia enhydra]SFZ84919.1 hypothetical protein SAMN02983003_2284 [Devosia enhydra]